MRESELPMHLADTEFEQDYTSIEDTLAKLLRCYPNDWTAGHWIDSGDLTTMRELLERHQLITVESYGARPWTLTSKGARVAREFAASLWNGPLRRRAVQRALLNQVWKFSDDPAGLRPPTKDIIGQVVGNKAVTENEHREAVRFLTSFPFINGKNEVDGGLLSPSITFEGMKAAEDPRSPEDYHERQSEGRTVHNGDNYTNNNSGNQGVAGIGKKVTLSDNTVTFAKAGEAREKVAEIKTLLGEIEDIPPIIESRFLALEAVSVDPEADESAWMKALNTFQSSLVEKFADASWAAAAGAAAALSGILFS